ncbi:MULTISPECIES: DUF6216 family protein [Xanthomonas]|uniref:Conserved hypothetical membrane protein n=1 Tax=Xanthomonas translucens pv. translucens DSM 18974 TaxID=1261556 RepID=A0A1C3TRQ3_XANCT|nr:MULTISPECIES: DUF6216 family protein [Xanthomonas]MCC8445364.1 DUF6216 family protein [Xanthomonas translucens pv. translucens]UKE50031.1 hypothetical protein KCU57_15105 [Xanthomonas translucens]WDK24323.1 hypothetical protein JH274_13320 [Xanthomonas campestris pv. incanae]CCP41491.1 hypothetical protein BN444_03216 [Xanthomonas translucens pv. translucens DSM 18974]SCB05855.1 Conserved hypothetical membrane protein [Xanthomonas translucens pv. translucens DSM 18974]
MDWIDLLTREIAPYSIVGFLLAASITCWRAGSFHPINARLLRFFISRDEVEDPVIKKSIADQAALISFRMTHGVRSRTLHDAKKLAEFSDFKNISLDLIGKAGWAFDLRKLEIIPKRIPRKYWFALPVVMFLFFAPAGMISLAVSASHDLLATLKKTRTDLWLSEDQAVLVRPFFGDRAKITKSDCTENSRTWITPEGFDQADRSILCKIWNDPKLSSEISKEIDEQRTLSLVMLVVCIWYLLMAISFVREWRAQLELNETLATDDAVLQSESEKEN